jgi:hypothetical protein
MSSLPRDRDPEQLPAESLPADLGVISFRLRAIVRDLADFKVGHLANDYRRRYPEGDPSDLGRFGVITGGRFARAGAAGDLTEGEAARGLLRGLLTSVQQTMELAKPIRHRSAVKALEALCGVERQLCSAGRGPGGIVERVRRAYESAARDYARDLERVANRIDAARFHDGTPLGDAPPKDLPPAPPAGATGGDPVDLRAKKRGLASVSELAKDYGVKRNAAALALSRFADRHKDCRVEVDSPRIGEPQFYYRRSDVHHVLESLQKRQTGDIRGRKKSQ